jgi:hypothetical protein
VAEGTDGYKVLYSIAEVDPAVHSGDVIVADTLNGHKLRDDGAFNRGQADRAMGPQPDHSIRRIGI